MIIGVNGTIDYFNGDGKKFNRYFPLPRSLSQREREDESFWFVNRKNCAAI